MTINYYDAGAGGAAVWTRITLICTARGSQKKNLSRPDIAAWYCATWLQTKPNPQLGGPFYPRVSRRGDWPRAVSRLLECATCRWQQQKSRADMSLSDVVWAVKCACSSTQTSRWPSSTILNSPRLVVETKKVRRESKTKSHLAKTPPTLIFCA